MEFQKATCVNCGVEKKVLPKGGFTSLHGWDEYIDLNQKMSPDYVGWCMTCRHEEIWLRYQLSQDASMKHFLTEPNDGTGQEHKPTAQGQ